MKVPKENRENMTSLWVLISPELKITIEIERCETGQSRSKQCKSLSTEKKNKLWFSFNKEHPSVFSV